MLGMSRGSCGRMDIYSESCHSTHFPPMLLSVRGTSIYSDTHTRNSRAFPTCFLFPPPPHIQMAVMCRFSITNTGLKGRGWWSDVFRCGSEHSASIYSVPAEDHRLLKLVVEWKVNSQQRSRKVAKLLG